MANGETAGMQSESLNANLVTSVAHSEHMMCVQVTLLQLRCFYFNGGRVKKSRVTMLRPPLRTSHLKIPLMLFDKSSVGENDENEFWSIGKNFLPGTSIQINKAPTVSWA